MTISIILNLFIIGCLISIILYAVLLNKRLASVYKNREELQHFLHQFTLSMQKAEENIQDLKGIGEGVFKDAEFQMKKAEALKDDLSFLHERGEDLAEKLDSIIRVARDLHKNMHEEKGMNALTLASGRMNAEKEVTDIDEDEGQPELVRHLKNVR